MRTKSAPCAVARRPERLGRRDELLVVELLVAELDDVDAAAQGGLESGGGLCGRAEDEIEAGASETLAAGRSVHTPSVRAAHTGLTPRPLRSQT